MSEQAIGLVFFAAMLALVLFQLPVAKALEGRSRMRALALAPLLWMVAWLVVEAGGAWFEGAAAALSSPAPRPSTGSASASTGRTTARSSPTSPRLASRAATGRSRRLLELGYVLGRRSAASSSPRHRSRSGPWPPQAAWSPWSDARARTRHPRRATAHAGVGDELTLDRAADSERCARSRTLHELLMTSMPSVKA